MTDPHPAAAPGARFHLVPCAADGQPLQPLGPLPAPILDLTAMGAAHYAATAFQPPWVGYLAVHGATVVGTGGFVGPPKDSRVEIAYGALAEHQRQGHATRTAAALIAIARAADPGLSLYAKTEPRDGPSPAILRRLGFTRIEDAMDDDIGLAWGWLLA